MSVDLNLVLIKLEMPRDPSITPGGNISIPLLKISCSEESSQKVVQVVERLKSDTDPFLVQADLSKPRASSLEGEIFSLYSGTDRLKLLEKRIAQAVKETLGLQRAPSSLPFLVSGLRTGDVQNPVPGLSVFPLLIRPSTQLRVELSRSPKPSSLPPPSQPDPSLLPQLGSFAVPVLPAQRKEGFSVRYHSASPVPVDFTAAPFSRSALSSQRPASHIVPVAVMPVIGRVDPFSPAPQSEVASAPLAQPSRVRSAPSAAIPNPVESSATTQVAAAALVPLQTPPSKAPSGREAFRREIESSILVLGHDVAMVRSRLTRLEPVVKSDLSKISGENRFIGEELAEIRTRVEGLEGLAALIERLVRHFDPASTL
jgi:hypothetical protein